MEPQTETPQVATLPAREWQWGWAAAFLANLPVPFFFGLMTTEKGGFVGMLVGMFAVWLCGHLIIMRVTAVRGVLLAGSVCTALSQALPLLQIMTGIAALDILAVRVDGRLTEAAAFLVTVFTAGQLLAAALICGSVLRGLGWLIEGRISRGHY